MDKLDTYLDQVCRSIGGPRSLRQHVRRELREHLLDAADRHKAAGLPEAEALDQALEEFGKPEDLRSELVETHGQRVLAVVIDKALEWKEKTMKARWLWMSWALLAVVLVAVLDVLFIAFTVTYIVPKFQKLTRDGLIDPAIFQEPAISWMPAFLNRLSELAGHATYWLLGAAGVWGLFEWRVKSENKAFVRLSLLGTVAVALTKVAWVTAAALLVCFCLGAPANGRVMRTFAQDKVKRIGEDIEAVKTALAKKDWETMKRLADRASWEIHSLATAKPAIPALGKGLDVQTAEQLQDDVTAASQALGGVSVAITFKDLKMLEAQLQTFDKSFESLRKAAWSGD